jgi:hypothetical protein
MAHGQVEAEILLRHAIVSIQLGSPFGVRSTKSLLRNPRERQVISWYSMRWRELRGGACDMGRPEAQIVSDHRWIEPTPQLTHPL